MPALTARNPVPAPCPLKPDNQNSSTADTEVIYQPAPGLGNLLCMATQPQKNPAAIFHEMFELARAYHAEIAELSDAEREQVGAESEGMTLDLLDVMRNHNPRMYPAVVAATSLFYAILKSAEESSAQITAEIAARHKPSSRQYDAHGPEPSVFTNRALKKHAGRAEKALARQGSSMADTFDYRMETPAPPAAIAQGIEDGWIETAKSHGAKAAYVKKIAGRWHFVAEWNEEDGLPFAQFCKMVQDTFPGLPPAQFQAKKAGQA